MCNLITHPVAVYTSATLTSRPNKPPTISYVRVTSDLSLFFLVCAGAASIIISVILGTPNPERVLSVAFRLSFLVRPLLPHLDHLSQSSGEGSH